MGRANWLRVAGGLLFAAGALVVLIRKGGEWSTLAILVTLLVPAVVLLGLGFLAPDRPPAPWRSTYLVIGTGLVPAVLIEFIEWIGGTGTTDLNVTWIFAVTAAVGARAAFRHVARYALLLAALALGVSWLALWDKIIGSPSLNTFRWLLFAIGVIYVLAAIQRREDEWHGDLVTAGGVAFVLIGVLTVVYVLIFDVLSGSFGRALLVVAPGGKPSEWWTISLLAESIGLIAYAARSGRRGPGYVGGAGLAIFVALVGLNIDALYGGGTRDAIDAWPLFLLIGGGAAIAAGSLVARREPAGQLDE